MCTPFTVLDPFITSITTINTLITSITTINTFITIFFFEQLFTRLFGRWALGTVVEIRYGIVVVVCGSFVYYSFNSNSESSKSSATFYIAVFLFK